MSIAIGILLIVLLSFQIYLLLLIKDNKKYEIEKTDKIEEKPQKVELSEEEKEKQEKIRKSFENLMGYGYEQALKSSKGE